MNILVQPMYSKQELNADSNYVVYSRWIRAMLEKRPDWHFVVIFPDANSQFSYDNDGFFALPNVTRVPQRISPRKMANAVTFDGIWYDKLFRKFGFDGVWCNLVEIAGHIRFAGQGSYEDAGKPIMVAAHNYVIHKSLPYWSGDSLLLPMLAQLQGAICADFNVFNSDHCLSMFNDNAKEWLSGATLERLKKSARKINYGTLENDWPKSTNGNSLVRIAYNHRLQSYKKYEATFRQLQTLWDEGLRFQVLYMNNTSEKVTRLQSFPFVKVKLCKNRSEYLESLATCDLNVINSVHETFCIAGIESMAFGQPFIAPNGVTFPEITGAKKNGYPFLFKGENEQLDILRKVITDHALRKKWGKVVQDHVRKNYSSHLWVERYATLFEEEAKNRELKCVDAIYEQAAALLKQNSGTTIRDFFNICQTKIRVDGKASVGNQSFPLTKIAKLVRHVGGEVKIEKGQQVVRIK